MPKRGVVLLWIAGLTLVLPAVCSAQVYAGATVGLGGAREPIGSYAGGYRGTLRLYGGYELNRHLAGDGNRSLLNGTLTYCQSTFHHGLLDRGAGTMR